MKLKQRTFCVCLVVMLLMLASSSLFAASNAGKTIYFMTVADPYVGAIRQLLPEFEEQTGIKVVIDSVPFPNLHEKAIMELASGRGSYDLISVDLPWTGEFVEAGFTKDLTDLVERDREEIDVDDFLPGAWE